MDACRQFSRLGPRRSSGGGIFLLPVLGRPIRGLYPPGDIDYLRMFVF